MTRIITALIGIPLLIYIVKFAPEPVCIALIFVSMLAAMHEYFQLTEKHSPAVFRVSGFCLSSIVLLSFYPDMRLLPFVLFAALPALLLTVSLFSRRPLAESFSAAVFCLFGIWYVGGLMGFLVGVRRIEFYGGDLLLLLMIIIWTNDSFAYFFGKTMGRHKLSPVVSPGKTIEGAVAGLIFGMAAAGVCCKFWVQQIPLFHAIVLGFLIGVTGQIGDLCESILKRAANVKDSGVIVPGHGGMLDRIDSLLFGAPTMYYYFYFVLQK